jgi:hypothetical protein
MQSFLPLLRFQRRKFCTKILGSVLMFCAFSAFTVDLAANSLIFKSFSYSATTAGISTEMKKTTSRK